MKLRYDVHNKYHQFAMKSVITITSLIVFTLVWWIIAMSVNRSVLPTPYETFEALLDLIENGAREDRSLWSLIWSSISKLIEGFGLAFIIALPIGLLLGNFKLIREFFSPWIEVIRPIAPIAWAPIFVILFGATKGSIMVVFIGIFFPLLTSIIFGVQKIDRTLVDAAKTLGASDWQIFTKVLTPSTIPYVMNGIKTGLGVGWMCIIAAELYNTTLSGVGYYIKDMIDMSKYNYAFAGIVIVAILGLLTTGLAEYLSKIVSKRMGISV